MLQHPKIQTEALTSNIQHIYGIIDNIKRPNSSQRLSTYNEFKIKVARSLGRENPSISIFDYNDNLDIPKKDNGNGQFFSTGNNITFGDIESHPIASKAVVFVSTYNMTTPPFQRGIAIRLPKKGDRDRYIVIQNPYHDGGNVPYEIRAHPILQNGTNEQDDSINITIKKTTNNGVSFALTNLDNGRVYTHVAHDHMTFSPDNMHITGLPTRTLKDRESYSFISHIDSSEKKIDTLHILSSQNIHLTIYNIAQSSQNLKYFIKQLDIAVRNNRLPGFNEHFEKLQQFISY